MKNYTIFDNPKNGLEEIMPSNSLEDWAALVYVIGPNGKTVTLVDPSKRNPNDKIPGGKRKGKETPQQTAQRELKEETGLDVDFKDLFLHGEMDKSGHPNPHTLFVFVAVVDDFSNVIPVVDEGEIVTVRDLSEIPKMENFFPPHWGYIKDLYV